MPNPLAIIAQLIAAPRISAPEPGLLRLSMPFLRVIRNRSGTISVPAPEAANDNPGTATGNPGGLGTAQNWMKIIGRLLPPLTSVRYDTGTGTVNLAYSVEPGAGSAAMTAAVERMVEVALEYVGRFLAMDRDGLAESRDRLETMLVISPVDMRDPGSDERLREMIGSL